MQILRISHFSLPSFRPTDSKSLEVDTICLKKQGWKCKHCTHTKDAPEKSWSFTWHSFQWDMGNSHGTGSFNLRLGSTLSNTKFAF